MKIRVGQHVRVLPCSSVAKTKQILTLQQSNKTTVTPTKKSQPYCELALCFQRILEQLRMATIAAAKRRMLIQNRK